MDPEERDFQQFCQRLGDGGHRLEGHLAQLVERLPEPGLVLRPQLGHHRPEAGVHLLQPAAEHDVAGLHLRASSAHLAQLGACGRQNLSTVSEQPQGLGSVGHHETGDVRSCLVPQDLKLLQHAGQHPPDLLAVGQVPRAEGVRHRLAQAVEALSQEGVLQYFRSALQPKPRVRGGKRGEHTLHAGVLGHLLRQGIQEARKPRVRRHQLLLDLRRAVEDGVQPNRQRLAQIEPELGAGSQRSVSGNLVQEKHVCEGVPLL
mmetsp:Transcript_12345/g.34835  ORF Transcript_12345/g.34835 Transcript_12345/m.34835 type:complete len:260 (+) Transcript_12345:317-1096(+)